MTDRPVLLVGSVPLADAEAVFRLAGESLGSLTPYFPDGETGERGNWIGWQFRHFKEQTALEQIDKREREYQQHPPLRLKPGADARDISFGALGFDRTAIASYEIFTTSRGAGIVPAEARFQVAMPTPFAPVYNFIAYESQAAVQPVYDAAMRAELETICTVIPHEDLAVQWDVATEMSIFEELHPAPFDDPWDVLIGRLAALSGWVPSDVALGYHLCYGSMGNKHWKEPEDLKICVKVANAVLKRVDRLVHWFHMPVPIERDDDAYFEALADLALPDGCTLYLGLVHDGDGIEGTRRRIATAARHFPDFGIATECGLGRRAAADVPGIFAVHKACAHD